LPFISLSTYSGSEIQVTLSRPYSDSGLAINSYKVEWDTDPGVLEVQSISTSIHTGPNEIQSISLNAVRIPETQNINMYATAIQEVQIVIISGIHKWILLFSP
jgi:hypothetical protein